MGVRRMRIGFLGWLLVGGRVKGVERINNAFGRVGGMVYEILNPSVGGV